VGLKLYMAIPLGHCLDEYIRMFSLEQSDLELAILDCAGGAASFNAEMTRQGQKVISCDRDYQFTAEEIRAHLQNSQIFIENFEVNFGSYRWEIFTSPSQLAEVRSNATQEFLEDFPSGLQQGRYVNASLPVLPFDDCQFDLALCSHFLFTDPDLLENFRLEAITEMCRVAKQVRVFPLLDRNGMESEHLNPIVTELRNRSFHVEEPEEVPYEFQIGGNRMLRISKKSSAEK
jgi:Methylase involved in ubiquinone/menaquinone biosynthesis